jgi:phosphoribosylamine--glycine ligase
VGDGDAGPNTGGMGAYAPLPWAPEGLIDEVMRDVVQPTLDAMARRGTPFVGLLYVGLALTSRGTRVVEFNVRFGDPETQAVLLRLDSDLAEAMLATVEGRLAEVRLDWSDDPAVCVVMAAGGYPGKYEKGKPISGLTEAAATGAVVFHAGTVAKGEDIVTAGGRVLGVTARGPTIAAAVKTAYAAVDRIHWDGAVCRRDIAHRALARESREG